MVESCPLNISIDKPAELAENSKIIVETHCVGTLVDDNNVCEVGDEQHIMIHVLEVYEVTYCEINVVAITEFDEEFDEKDEQKYCILSGLIY